MNYITIGIFCFIFGLFTAILLGFIILSKFRNLIKNDFVQLANETIKSEQEDLRKQNRESLEEKLAPITKELGEFKSKVEKFNVSGVENTVKIIEQIANMEKNNKVIEQETKNLVNALTKNQNVKGAYGEGILETVLEACGMKEGIHYVKQYATESYNLKDDNLHSIRPDIVINLQNDRHLIIDSKFTLTSYLDFIEDKTKIKEFKDEVKKRINDLAQKNYQSAGNIYQPDFILMYMPLENAVSLLYDDMEIINKAYNSNIVIIGTSGLITAIRLVNQLFAQKKQNENLTKIVEAGNNLYETFVRFCNDLIELQKDFSSLQAQFNTTINRFKRNSKTNPSIFSQVEELKSFGITSLKQIPNQMFEEDNIEKEIGIND